MDKIKSLKKSKSEGIVMVPRSSFLKKVLSLTLTFTFICTQLGLAQVATELNLAAHLGRIQSGLIYEKFRAPHLRYFSYDNTTNNLNVLLDKGDIKDAKGALIEDSAQDLLKYFLIGVVLPDENFWVNLRPDSEDNIISGLLAKTDIGKILLEADVQLKKDTALLTSPQTPQGKIYWDRLYKKAYELYGSDSVSIPTLTRPWIVPGEIVIRESKDSAYIYKANLKVMLEEDHLKGSATYSFKDPLQKALNEYSSGLIRELIIPQLTKEVNNSKAYAQLRQVYYSLILARWFKSRFYGKGGVYPSYINSQNLNHLTSDQPWSKSTYFKLYQDSFNKGEYNLKTPVNTLGGASIRSYFSGGIAIDRMNLMTRGNLSSIAAFTGKGEVVLVPAALNTGLLRLSMNASDALLKIISSPLEKETQDELPMDNLVTRLVNQVKDDSLTARVRTHAIARLRYMEAQKVLSEISSVLEALADENADSGLQEEAKETLKYIQDASSPLRQDTIKKLEEMGTLNVNDAAGRKKSLEYFLELAKVAADKGEYQQAEAPLNAAMTYVGNDPGLLLSVIKFTDENGFTSTTNECLKILEGLAQSEHVRDVINKFILENKSSSPLSSEALNQLRQVSESSRIDSSSPIEDVEKFVGRFKDTDKSEEWRIDALLSLRYRKWNEKVGGALKGLEPTFKAILADGDGRYSEWFRDEVKLALEDIDKSSSRAGAESGSSPVENMSIAQLMKNFQDLRNSNKKYSSEVLAMMEIIKRQHLSGSISPQQFADVAIKAIDKIHPYAARRDKRRHIMTLANGTLHKRFANRVREIIETSSFPGDPPRYLVEDENEDGSTSFEVFVGSSPMQLENKLLNDTVDKLQKERFESRVNALYGLTKEEAQKVDPKLTAIGFDGNENRLGWSIANLGWLLNNPDKIELVLDDAKKISEKYENVIFCGMGGSGLAVETVKTTFGQRGVKIYSLRTTDPAVIADMLRNIVAPYQGSYEEALRKTLVIPISKSGRTEETVSHKKYFEALYAKYGVSVKDHIWVITDKGTPMDTGDYLQREIQLNGKGDIGGRFTAPTTNIFLLPLALVAPEKVKTVLQIAKGMNSAANASEDVFLRLGSFLYLNAARFGRDKLTMLVPEELKDLPFWAEQLFEESLGKDGKGVTLFYGEDISLDALSPTEKNDRVFVRINLKGRETDKIVWDVLREQGYPVFEINVEDKDSIGGLMLGFQRAVAAIAYLWDINFVNQPAVEDYKKATRAVMSALKPGERVAVPEEWQHSDFKKLKLFYGPLFNTGAISAAELTEELDSLEANVDNAPAVYAAIMNILNRKGGFEAIEFASYGRMTPFLRKTLENARSEMFTRGLKMPSKLGEGPDKNHSFHQNIEDGKDMFISTYLLIKNIEQPRALEYSENLIKAQAIGTVNSLVSKNRKVVLITADASTNEAATALGEFFASAKQYLKVSSSPMEVRGMKTGGIDFRSLPMTCMPMGGFCGLSFSLPKPASIGSIDVDNELQEINLMVERGIVPSGERVKELVAACYHRQELAGHAEELMSCLMRICKLEEDMVVASDKELKEALVIVDSL